MRSTILQALVLSISLGSAVAYTLRAEGRWALAAMGAAPGSILSSTGLPYLRTRALAAPAVLMLMVSVSPTHPPTHQSTPILPPPTQYSPTVAHSNRLFSTHPPTFPTGL